MSFTDFWENEILDHILDDGAYTAPSPVYVGISTTTPTDAGTNFTEPASGGYARVAAAAAVWDADYKGVWHLNESASDEGSGAVHYDSTANNNDGTQNENTEAVGKIGFGQNFDGDDDFIKIANAASLQPTTAITLSGWIYLRSFGSGGDVDVILRKGENNPNNYQLMVGDQIPQFVLDDDDATRIGTTILPPNTWHYMVATWQSGGQTAVYLNGMQNATGSFSGPIGTDTRPSGEMVERAVTAGLMSVGTDIVNIGTATTPTIQYAVHKRDAAGGIIISASHNPEEWNAIKFLGRDGLLLTQQQGMEVVEIAESESDA